MLNPIHPTGDLMEALRACGGVYECPKDTSGKRLGPLVGYAGKYDAGGGDMKAYVGDVYYNFAMAERRPSDVMSLCVAQLGERISFWMALVQGNEIDCFLGAPEGGKALAYHMAWVTMSYYVFAEKKVTALATGTSREESKLVLDRHVIEPGWRVALTEDVCNNFSTTEKLIRLVKEKGATVAAIICAINRSMGPDGKVANFYMCGEDEVPVLTAVEIPTLQYRQDDPAVADDVAAGNVVWKPKDGWEKLLGYGNPSVVVDHHGVVPPCRDH